MTTVNSKVVSALKRPSVECGQALYHDHYLIISNTIKAANLINNWLQTFNSRIEVSIYINIF